MSKKADYQLVTIRLYRGDIDRLERFFPQLKYNRAIREIVHAKLNAIQEALQQQGKPAPKAEDL